MRDTLLGIALWAGAAQAALQVDLTSSSSIKQAASLLAYDLLKYYKGNVSGATPGILPGPPPNGDYYWWEAGAMWGTLVDYWHFTGDTTYNNLTSESLVFQGGAPDYVYMPENWTASLGNDDQGFWGMSAMLAAEVNFPNPPDGDPGWLALAQGVWNTQASPIRHDNTCGGGLRWQIPPTNNGYNYKNSIVNGIYMNLGARLARYTANQTYLDAARATWDWEVGVGFMDADYNVYDGGHVDFNCTDIAKAQYSYNAAVWTQAAAFMYNITTGNEQAQWEARTSGLLNRTFAYFWSNGIMTEPACETPLDQPLHCTTDMLSFKGYVHRWLAQITQVAPFTHATIMPMLRSSAAGAVSACSGGDTGRACGYRWTVGQSDGVFGAGQTMSALAALCALLVDDPGIVKPLTNATGGTSKGNPNAGSGPQKIDRNTSKPITTGDRVGAGILTFLMLLVLVGSVAFMMMQFGEMGGSAPMVRVSFLQRRGVLGGMGSGEK